MSAQRHRRTLDEPINLDRVVTRGGDPGTTSLGTGRRLPKCDLPVEAYGEVDELNAALGLAHAALPAHSRFRPWLDRIQNDLYDVGADLAPPPEPDKDRARLRVACEQVEWLDHACEEADHELAPLRTFALPGGSEASARLQLARTVCRRAERRSIALALREPVNPHLLAYLNRLGDLLFILARAVDADSGARPRLCGPGAATLAHAAERIPARPPPRGRERVTPPPLRFDVPLAPYTTFGIGGPARLYTHTRTSAQLLDALLWARTEEVPHVVLGGGSNVLVADDGYDGLVIRNAGSQRTELLPGGRLRTDSGAMIGRLIALTVERGLSGLEHFAGIPCTLGGALWQNLHFLAPERDRLVYIGDLVEEATVLVGGEAVRVGHDWFGFGYDASAHREGRGVVLDATLHLRPADPEALGAVVAANLAWRAERHPSASARRSAGCAFRNLEGASAARAIDAAGLKGMRVGGAVVSRRHANFVLNDRGATAADVRALIELVAERVERHSGLRLEPELAFLGAFERGTVLR